MIHSNPIVFQISTKEQGSDSAYIDDSKSVHVNISDTKELGYGNKMIAKKDLYSSLKTYNLDKLIFIFINRSK